MRRLSAIAILLLLVCPALVIGQNQLAGTWKITFLEGDNLLSFWVLALENKDGKLSGSVTAVPKAPDIGVKDVGIDGDMLKVNLDLRGMPIRIACKVPKGQTEKLRGTLTFQGTAFPVQLEQGKLEKLKDGTAMTKVPPPNGKPGAKGAFGELEQQARESANDLAVFHYAMGLVHLAEDEKIASGALKQALTPVLKAAAEYGPDWVQEVYFNLAGVLAKKAPYADLAEELAQSGLKDAGPKAAIETQMRALDILTAAFRAQKKNAELAAIKERIANLEIKGYEENEKAGLGFALLKPAPHKGNRTVLVELFTGAMCPPCVAADIGFEGLGETYKWTEVILLQYHLHIPGPDALATEETEARADIYGKAIQGTPAIFFNGKSVFRKGDFANGDFFKDKDKGKNEEWDMGGGGPKPLAEAKYKDYCSLIDHLLDESTKMTLKAEAVRVGDTITITATGAGYKAGGDKARLRFALVEPWVRYPGSNGIVYHAHVVRALPGGAKGIPLPNEGAAGTVKIDIGELKTNTDKYLSQIGRLDGQRPFSFRNLHVVAFIQDDSTQEVLQAVRVAVK
jgi:hypothetical protein